MSKHILPTPGILHSAAFGATLGVAVAFAIGASAQIIDIGGPLKPGHARPPLFLNLGPFSTSSASAPPYTPQQVRHAYGFDQLIGQGITGSGQTIAIIDAYGSKSAQKDLNTFCSYFGIPSTTLTIAYPQGTVKQINTGWAQETALDVEWAHAIAPGAKILLVVAIDNSTDNLLGAVDYAVNYGAKVVSMSWGAGEYSGVATNDTHFTAAAGVTFVASSGDNGEGVEWPAASPYVVGVGGTSLTLKSDGSYGSETAWSGGGGGISLYETPVPTYQLNWMNSWNTQGGWSGSRGVPDVSYLADPNTGVYVVYGGRLYVFGGTSVGAPQWAALVALSNSTRTTSTLNNAVSAVYSVAAPPNTTPPYKSVNSANFFDVTSGSNGSDPDDSAFPGYDLATGVGSPVAGGVVRALAGQ